MKKEIIVNSSSEETRVAVIENGKLTDLFYERFESEKIIGNIYKGRVKDVLPGISSAFVDIGLDKSGYLYVDDVISDVREKRIEKMIQKGKEVLVQVDKEPINTKGARITMDISLPGRLLVYMPMSDHIGISKNIDNHKERDRLRDIINANKPEQGGFILRTEAEEATEKELKREMRYLVRLWNSIKDRNAKAKTPALVHKDLGMCFQTVRDYFNEEADIMMIDSPKEYRDVIEFVKIISPELLDKVKQHQSKTPIFKAFNIEEEIKKLRSNRVKLPSGGSIIIQEAESLCAIDVNTGKYTGSRQQTQEETITKTNIEAAHEVARQLRLRNIGGIIVIDFIDMRKAKNRQRVLDSLRGSCRGDKAKIKIWPITQLGLIEMTRERKRESLFALLGETCPTCHGLGLVLSKESLFIALKNELINMNVGKHAGRVRVRLAPEVAAYVKERIGRLKHATNCNIDVQAGKDVEWEDYQIIVD
ncbi:MAG: Rne/Rng family ribonuclease [Endomicrobiales bacterium]|nr:Rne/Rng family ribonuclease [Endomicrobiales bacterium]